MFSQCWNFAFGDAERPRHTSESRPGPVPQVVNQELLSAAFSELLDFEFRAMEEQGLLSLASQREALQRSFFKIGDLRVMSVGTICVCSQAQLEFGLSSDAHFLAVSVLQRLLMSDSLSPGSMLRTGKGIQILLSESDFYTPIF